MKRRTIYGAIRSTDGASVRVTSRAVAQTLTECQERIEALEEVIKNGKAWSERQDRLLRERTADLARLQNHWVVRAAEALGIIQVGCITKRNPGAHLDGARQEVGSAPPG